VRETGTAEPAMRFKVTEKEASSPRRTVWVEGESEMEKSKLGGGGACRPTVREALVCRITPLAEPTTTIM